MTYFNKTKSHMPLHMPLKEYVKVSNIPVSNPYTRVNNNISVHNTKKNKNHKNNKKNKNISIPDPNNIYMGTGHNGIAFKKNKNQVTKLFFNNNYVPELTKKLSILEKVGITSGITINGVKKLKNVYPPYNTNRTKKNTYHQLHRILQEKSGKQNNTNDSYHAINMPHFGTSLNKLTYDATQLPSITKLIESSIQFMNDIKKLQTNHYVHGDLNLGNIIINKKTYKLTMIDFDYLSSYDRFLDNQFINLSIYPRNYLLTILELSDKKRNGTLHNSDKNTLYSILDYTDTYAAGLAFIHMFDIFFHDTLQLNDNDQKAINQMKIIFNNMTQSTDPYRIGPDEVISQMKDIQMKRVLLNE